MSKRKPDVYLQDILESIGHIQRYLDNVSEDEFYENVEKQDAVLRRLEIIGEAVKQLPEETRENHRSEEHTSELQSRGHIVCRLLLENTKYHNSSTDIYKLEI